MAQAFDVRTADFLGGSGKPLAMPTIYAPGEEPNKKNPGGISDNELARRKDAAQKKATKEHYDAINKANSKAIGKRIVAEREAFAKTQPGFFGRAASDLKVLGPAVLKVVGTGAAIVATGGAAAGAIGLGAGLAGITAAAITADKVIGAVNTGGKVVSSLKKGDVAGLAGAAKSGLAQAGIKTPPLPSAAKAGGQIVAALPKNIVSDAKAQLASAKQITSSAKAAIAAPKAAAAAVVKAVAKVPVTAAKAAEDKLRAQLDPLSLKLLDTVKGAKIVVAKNGKVSVSTPAAATAAAALFKPALTTVKAVVTSTKVQPLAVSGMISKPTPASASVTTIKPPAASSKPPAMTQNRPPAPSASVGASIPSTASSSAPPALKPPPVANDATSSAPALEGYLVRLNGTIAPRGRYRAA